MRACTIVRNRCVLCVPVFGLTSGRALLWLLLAGDFGVNKEAQAKVSAEMDKFIGDGGGLLLYVAQSPR